jgi:hypothetical protein
MKSVSIIKILVTFSLLYLVYNKNQYSESMDMVMERLQWNRNHTQQITKGRVEFEYSDDKGTHCLSKAELYQKKFTFRIPKEYLICACK